LKAAAKGRPSNAALLLRKNGKPWNENDPSTEYRPDVRNVVESIGLDSDVYGLYAFRHTSITRMLLAGTHTAIVAKCHDTSEAMIRKHYAASILDYTDEITRKTLPALGACAAASGEQCGQADEAPMTKTTIIAALLAVVTTDATAQSRQYTMHKLTGEDRGERGALSEPDRHRRSPDSPR
jgi:hypothetical protein